MKSISEKFTDEEHKKLITAKEKKTWHDFIMELTGEKDKQKKLE